MPIPSVTCPSNNSSSSMTVATIVVTEVENNAKCKYATNELSNNIMTTRDEVLINNNDTMETDVTTIESKQEETCKKSKQNKVLLLHARREDDDLVVNLTEERLCPISISGLYAGSKFYGTQKCGTASYEVNVELLHVDMEESTMSGYLKIKGLTSEFPELTTFFEAEVMGRKYSFHTRKWQADQKSDLLHWKKFPSFKPYIDIFNNDSFVYDPNDDSDYIYMRWKETFLVPDHHVSAIHGASFAGFYYICYRRSTNQIKGFYFFRNHKDWFQELTLNHVPERRFGRYEFR